MSMVLVPAASTSSTAGAAFSAGAGAGAGAGMAGGAASTALALPLAAGASLVGALGYGCCRKRRRTEGGGDGGSALAVKVSLERVANLEARLARAEERLALLEEARPAKAARLEPPRRELSSEGERRLLPPAPPRAEVARETGPSVDQKATVDLVEKRLQGFKDSLQHTVDQAIAGVWVRLGEKAQKTDVAQLDDQVSLLQWSLEDMADKVEDVEHLDRRVSCLRDRLEEKADQAQLTQIRAVQDDLPQNQDTLQPHAKEPVPAESCCAEARRMLAKYPDRIPVICQPAACSNLPCMNSAKLLVFRSMLCSELKPVVHKRIQGLGAAAITSDQIVLSAGSEPLEEKVLISELYNQYKAEDGFLYITYSAVVADSSH